MTVSTRNQRLLAELRGAPADRMDRIGLRTEGDI
jgi:hypothetical protein